MLVIHRTLAKPRDERGSTIVTVLVVMLTLTVLALSLGSLVIGTTQAAVNARGSIQAKAAADAGISAAVAAARRTGNPCSVSLDATGPPAYEVTAICASNRVTFTSTGTGADGGVNTVKAVYEYTSDPGTGEDMVFYGDTTFTHEVLTYPLDTDLLSIVIPTGNFICQSVVPANIMLSGTFRSQGGCDVAGSVIAGGAVEMTNTPDIVRGTLTASSTSPSRVDGKVLGNLFVGGPLNFAWSGFTYPGTVQAGGAVNLTNVSIAGGLTMPYGSKLEKDGWITIPPTATTDARIAGGIARPTTVTPPPAPTFDAWFDYTFAQSDWPGYQLRTLSKTGTGANTCGYFNNSPGTGWKELAKLTTPTIIDARACGTLSSQNGSKPDVKLRADLVFLAKSFDLGSMKIDAASGAEPKVWWIVEDTQANGSPTCSGGAGNIVVNGTVMGPGMKTMAYTPCVVEVRGGASGIEDEWTGSFYGGSFSYGGGLRFFGSPIALPGMSSGGGGGEGASGSIGNLISKRDTVPSP